MALDLARGFRQPLPLLLVPLAALCAIGLVLAAPTAKSPAAVPVAVMAEQFAYSPGVVHVPSGATVHLSLESHDVTHGLFLEGYGVSLVGQPGRPTSADFVADRPGRYRFYCNTTCGQLHPFMVGELIVDPNRSFGVALALVPLAASLGLIAALPPARPAARRRRSSAWSIDLTDTPLLRWVVKSRFLHQAIIAGLLAGLTLAALAGLFGAPVGSHNFAIVFVWIVWWGLLKLVLIPLGGRAWCAVCPLPAPGEWLQRGGIVTPRPGRRLTLGLAWPRRLRGGWIATATLLGIGVASAPILTRPALTGAFLAGVAGVALVLAVIFRGRVFCRYVCPVGGFVGLYSLAAPLGVRPRDPAACRTGCARECVRGSASAFGCGWLNYPGGLSRNLECGLCLECVRACPHGNMRLVLTSPGEGLVPDTPEPAHRGATATLASASAIAFQPGTPLADRQATLRRGDPVWSPWVGRRGDSADPATVARGRGDHTGSPLRGGGAGVGSGGTRASSATAWPRADEAFGAIVMLALALVYTAVFFGPWGDLKQEALLATVGDLARHTVTVVGVAAVAAPAAWLGLAALIRLAGGRGGPRLVTVWAGSAATLVPLGLWAWISFTIAFVLNSGTYVLGATADPLGWGWNLGGLTVAWHPLLTEARPWLQLAGWLIGLTWASVVGGRVARRLWSQPAQVARAAGTLAFGLSLVTGGLVWLGLG